MPRWIVGVVGVLVVFAASVANAQSLIGGGLTARPPVSLGTSVVQNGTFDTLDGNNRPTNWTGFNSQWSVDVGRSGTGFSAKLTDSHLTGVFDHVTQSVAVTKGVYRLSGWIRTQNLGTNCTGCPQQGGVRLNVTGGGTSAIATDVVNQTTGWTLYQSDNIVVPAAGTVTVMMEVYGAWNGSASVQPNGTAWFDDVKLERQLPKPVEAYILYPNFRGMLFEDKPQTMRFDVTVNPPGGGDPAAFTVTGRLKVEATGAVIASQTYPGAANFEATLDGSNMQPGQAYLAEFSINTTPAYTYPAYRVSKVTAAQRAAMNVAFDEKNRFLLHDTPRFILGVYDAGLGYTTNTATYESMLWSPTGERRMNGLPINMYINLHYGAAPADAMNALMTNLQSHGVMYLQTGNCFAGANHFEMGPFQIDSPGQSYVQNIGAHAGSAGYYTMDECEASPDSLIQTTFDQYLNLRSWDPDGLTMAAGGGAGGREKQIFLWRDAVDVLGMDPYVNIDPVAYNVANWSIATREATKNSRPFMQILAFLSPFPTLDQMRSQAYTAIVEGAKGLFWWQLGNQIRGLAWNYPTWTTERTNLMNQLKSVVSELATLEPVLLADADPARLTGNSNSAIKTLVKVSGGKGYVFAYNSTAAAASATFTWNVAPGTVTVNAEGRTITPSGNSFTDSFGPNQAHVYVIQNPGSGGPGAPTLVFTNPANGATVSGTVPVSLAASGGTPPYTNYRVTANGTQIHSGPASSFNWNTSGASGTYTLVGTVTDSASPPRTGQASITVNVQQPPGCSFSIGVTAPTNGETISGTNWIQVWSSNGQGTVNYTVTVAGAQRAGQPQNGQPTSIAWDTTQVANGAQTITVTGTDGAGCTSTVNINVTVSNGPPLAIFITGPTDGQTISGNNWVIVWSENAIGAVNYTVSVAGAQRATQAQSSPQPTSIMWNTTSVANGAQVITVTGTDGAGRTATDTVNVNVAN